MLSHCLNPACAAPFRYLRDGRIFQMEIPVPPESTFRQREYFWLCSTCCSTLTVVLRDGQVLVQSRFSELASKSQGWQASGAFSD